MSSTWRNTSHIDSTIFYAEDDLNDAVFRVPPPTDNAVFDNANLVETINTAVAAGGGEVRFAAGTYLFTAAAPEVSAGGSFSDGTVVGLKFTGGGRGVTILNFAPTAATWLFTVGDGVLTAGHCGFSDLTIILGNTTAAGAILFRDPCRFCTVENVQIIGTGVTAGTGIRMSGMVSANSFHTFYKTSFRSLLVGMQFSGFANSNKVDNCWFGVCADGILSDSVGTDTSGGTTNKVYDTEFNGTTTRAISLNSNSTQWTMAGVTCDGPTTSLTISASSDYHTFVGCVLPVVSGDVTSSVFVNCRQDHTSAAGLKIGDVMLWRNAANSLTIDDNLTAPTSDIQADRLRLSNSTDSGATTSWEFSKGSPSTNDFSLKKTGSSNLLINGAFSSEDLKLSYTGGKVGLMGATPVVRQAVTGSLSTVADAPAKAVLTSIIAALVAYGLATNSTT